MVASVLSAWVIICVYDSIPLWVRACSVDCHGGVCYCTWHTIIGHSALAFIGNGTVCWISECHQSGMCSVIVKLYSLRDSFVFVQILEIPYDAKMGRTKNRVLVRERIRSVISTTQSSLSCTITCHSFPYGYSIPHAIAFAAASGLGGVTLLSCLVNPLAAVLGAFNLLLYTAVYTPLKRYTIANTWIGSIVGAIPPMMGWAGSMGNLGMGAWLLGGILFSWQLVHFHSLSWSLKGDYGRGGYKMASSIDPSLCRRSTLRHSLALIPLCTLASVLDVTTWWFAVDSLPLNCWLAWKSWQFYRDSDNKSARRVFHLSLFYLPALMCLMIINKKSLHSSDEDKDKEHEEDHENSRVQSRGIGSGLVQVMVTEDQGGTN